MDKVTLNIDLDEVVFHYIEGLRKHMLSRGMVAPDGNPPYYSFEKSGWFASDTEFKVVHGEAVDEGLYRNLELIEGACETMNELVETGYRINIVTSRFVNPGQHQTVVRDTSIALDKHNIPYSNISFLKDKTIQRADLWVDDAPHNINNLRGVGQEVIAFDLPYNQDIEGLRASNWNEVRQIIRDKFGK